MHEWNRRIMIACIYSMQAQAFSSVGFGQVCRKLFRDELRTADIELNLHALEHATVRVP